jgi:hypothetical protein
MGRGWVYDADADEPDDRFRAGVVGFCDSFMAVDDSPEPDRDPVVEGSTSTPVVDEDAAFRLRFKGGGEDPSVGRFLHDRWRVPGRLSGPLRFGAVSYMHSFFRRTQLLHEGLFESQRIFRPRQGRHAMTTVEISLDVPRLEVVSTKGEDGEVLVLVPLTGMFARYGLSYVEYSAKGSEVSIRAECDVGIGRREPDWSGGSIAKNTWLRPNEG